MGKVHATFSGLGKIGRTRRICKLQFTYLSSAIPNSRTIGKIVKGNDNRNSNFLSFMVSLPYTVYS